MSLVTLLLSLVVAQADDFRWVQRADDPGRLYLYRGDMQVGGYDLDEHFYRRFDGSTWGARAEPPIPPPCFGVSRDKIGPAPVYRINGQPVSAETAYEAVDKGLADDSRKLRLTIIGPSAARTRA